jgi:hypothetical protein
MELSPMSGTIKNQSTTTAPSAEIVWGARAIGATIGRSEKAAFAILEAGKLAGARKVAGRWALNTAVFFKSFEAA